MRSSPSSPTRWSPPSSPGCGSSPARRSCRNGRRPTVAGVLLFPTRRFLGDFSQRLDPGEAVGTGVAKAAAVAGARQGTHCGRVDQALAFGTPLSVRRLRAHRFTLRGTVRSSGDGRFGAVWHAAQDFLTGGRKVFAWPGMKRDAGTTSFLSCLGFLCSRLLLCSPLGIRVLLMRDHSQTLQDRGGGASRPRDGRSDSLQIDRGRLTVLAFLELVRDVLVLVERAEAGAFDCRDVHEHVLGLVVRLDETETLA